MNKNIHIIKLINGELLIGTLTIGDDAYVLHNSYQIAIIPNQQTGQDSMVFLDFNSHFTDDKDLRVPISNVLYSFRANANMQKAYIERESNIILPQPDLAGIAE
jgi:hypothetical protein